MKNAATWSVIPQYSVLRDSTNYWRSALAAIANLFTDTAAIELAQLHAKIAVLEQENSYLKCQLNTNVAPAELARLAFSDCLTGLANRRALLCAATREMNRMSRTGRAACVLMVDIDHFKAINDDFGHAAGDAVLRLTAQTLVAQTRTTDTVARWGGEEFVLLLPETDLAAAQVVAEKCRLAVSAQNSAQTQPPRAVTITLGVSQISPFEAIETAIARADAALYEGKASGRNRVVVR